MSYQNRYRKPTVSNVAERAGVSVTTVSHVVNGVRAYSAETEAKVRKAIAELNYTPSYIAKGARQKTNHVLGVCTNDPWRTVGGSRKRFAEALWSGVTEEADRHGFSLLHYAAKIQSATEHTPFLDGFVDGLLMLVQPEDSRPAALAAAGLPVVLMAASPQLPEGVGGVGVDEFLVAAAALEPLHAAGHRRIAHLTGPDTRGEPGETDGIACRRHDAYEAWMAKHGLLRPGFVRSVGSWDPESVTDQLNEWLALPEPPTAVFCANDTIARVLIAAARDRGLSVPRDLSVTGVDGDPEISSVPVPVGEIGSRSVDALLRLMSGEPVADCRIALAPGPLNRLHTVAPPL